MTPQERKAFSDEVDAHFISMAEVSRRFEALEGRTTGVEKAVEKNTQITSGIASDTSELLELFKSVKGGFKVMSWLGGFAKWIAAIAAAFAGIYAFVQNIRGGH